MFFNLLPREHARAIAERFGESELTVRAIVVLALLVALAGTTVGTMASFDPSLLAGTDPLTAGSERVLRAFIGLGVVVGLSLVAGVSGFGHWLHCDAQRRLASRARAGVSAA